MQIQLFLRNAVIVGRYDAGEKGARERPQHNHSLLLWPWACPTSGRPGFSHHRLEMTIPAKLRVVVRSNENVYVKELLKAYKGLLTSLSIFYQLVEAQLSQQTTDSSIVIFGS